MYQSLRKMSSKSVLISLLSIIPAFVYAERNISPSQAVCATFTNEEFLIDLRKGQNTCEFYGRRYCPLDYYKPRGDCYCKDGFARLAEDGKCVSVTKNAQCVAKLPIQPESCTGPNERYSEMITTGICAISCLTFGCSLQYPSYVERWSPNCKCIKNYNRLSNGTCVPTSSDQCIAEFQPSPARCTAIGLIYKLNAPCQVGCYGQQYCYPPGGTCICPAYLTPTPSFANYLDLNTKNYVNVYGVNCVYEDDCPERGGG